MRQVVEINTKDLQENIRKCENSLKTLQDSCKQTKSALSCDSVNRQFTLSKTSNKQLQENSAVLKSVRGKSIHVEVKFDENAEILRFVKRLKMFGKVSVKKEAMKFEWETDQEEMQKINGKMHDGKMKDAGKMHDGKPREAKSPRRDK